jgi:hypothetical protein
MCSSEVISAHIIPLFLLSGDVSATRLETLQPSLNTTPTSPGKDTTSDNMVAISAE